MSAKGSNVRSKITVIATVVIAIISLLRFLPISKDTKISLGYPEDSLLNFTELTHKYEYLSEEHTVTTEDGYILRIFRITKGRKCFGQKKTTPVLLMHGVLQNAASWLDSGPNSALPYLVSDTCFDIWLGNNRGNRYSRRHVTLDPDKDPEFWRFSADEIGLYDVPAIVDYILDYTGGQKLNYIGYSQGSALLFIMCSEKPGYCDKVKVAITLAPSSRHINSKTVIYKLYSTGVNKLFGLLNGLGMGEVLSKGSLKHELLAFICQMNDISYKICSGFFGFADGFHPGSITRETMETLFGHYPDGVSLQNMARIGQLMNSRDLVKFDYGGKKNLKLYGSVEPPKYNLSAVTAPIICIYGKNDQMVDPKDVKWLVKKLPNVAEVMEVKNPLWTHMDMAYSQHAKKLVYPKVIEYLSKYDE